MPEVPTANLRNDEVEAQTFSSPNNSSPLLVEGSAPTLAESATPFAASRGSIPFTALTIENPADPLYSPHGKIFGRDSTGEYDCSGTVINSNDKSLVWTAAHCVMNNGDFANFLAFAPGYEEGNEPFGLWFAQQVFVPNGWSPDEDPTRGLDFAIIKVAPSESGALLGDVVGTRGIAFNQQPNEGFQSFGYPGFPNPPFTGEQLLSCQSTGTWRILPPVVAMGCHMKEGSSGGGWIMREGYLNSNVSFGIPGIPALKNVSFGPYLGSAAKTLYDLARGESTSVPEPTQTSLPGPYVKHRMRVTFDLNRHLIASGKVTARSGFSPCAYLAPIDIIKFRFDRQGDPVFLRIAKTVLTKSDGTYRTKIRDRAGYYLAVAWGGGYDLSNDCGDAESRYRRHNH